MEILARAVGRRKEAVAQVQLVRGNGQFLINDKPAQAYLQNNSCSLICIKSPLEAALSLYSNNVSNLENTSSIKPEGSLMSAPPFFPKSESEGAFAEKSESIGSEKLPTTEEQNALKTTPLPTAYGEEIKHQEKGQINFGSLPISAPSNKTGVPSVAAGEANFTNGSGNPGAADAGTNFLPLTEINASSTQPALSLDEIDVIIKVKGGGLIGQAEAIKLGIARAFCFIQVSPIGTDGLLRKTFKTKGFLTQDSRIKERRKYGLKKARKASQYHKR